MKTKSTLLALLLATALPFAASAQVYVHGYAKKDGTYVQPHYRSSPNSTKADNYSTRGNVNPYTGQPGTRDPYATSANPYAQPQSSGNDDSSDDGSSDDGSDDGWRKPKPSR